MGQQIIVLMLGAAARDHFRVYNRTAYLAKWNCGLGQPHFMEICR